MDKNKLAAIEILSKVKDSLENIIASGEYTNYDKRNLLKTKAALKWLREGKETADELPTGDCNKPHVSGSAFVIMYQKKTLKNILFQSCNEARNYIKMQNPTRTFKEPEENVFVCSRYGTTFEIVELHYR